MVHALWIDVGIHVMVPAAFRHTTAFPELVVGALSCFNQQV